MRKKKRTETEFYEALTPSMAYGVDFSHAPTLSTPLWVYPAWIAGSIVLGILLGLAIKDFQATSNDMVPAGIVANIADPDIAVASNAIKLAQTASVGIQAGSNSIQGNQSTVQGTQSVSSFQNGFSAYGQQGSIGTASVR